MTLYGPKPDHCPTPFEHCGKCNIYPCVIPEGPTPAPGTEHRGLDRLSIEVQAIQSNLIQLFLDKDKREQEAQ